MNYYGKSKQVLQQILDAFKNGTVPAAMAQRFIHRKDDKPVNRWSVGNQLLTCLAGTDDARTFNQWLEAGRAVKKGSHAFFILKPYTFKKTDKATGEEKVAICGFGTIPVFAIEETEIVDEALWNKCAGNTAENVEFVKSLPFYAVAQEWNIDVDTYTGARYKALGYFQHGTSRKKIALGTENLSTWSHELNHAADFKNGTLDFDDRAGNEVVAELGGAALLLAIGEKTAADIGGAWNYIKHYSSTEQDKAISACNKFLKRIMANMNAIMDTAEQLKAAQKKTKKAA